MNKLFRMAVAVLLTGLVLASTTGCYVVYDHRGGGGRGYGYGYGYQGHHHQTCSPHGW